MPGGGVAGAPAIAWPHLEGWPVSLVAHPDSRWQLADFGTDSALMGAAECLFSRVFNSCVSDQ